MAMLLVLIFALAASVGAQKITLNPSPAAFTLVAGMVQTVQFRLSVPIICQNQNAECSVVVRITNGDTTAVALDTCMVKWLDSEWSQIRTVTIRSRPSFSDDAQRTITLTTELAVSGSLYYNNTNPNDITLTTARRRSKQCSGTGDPHYTTFDGYYWHFYDLTQNVLYRSTAVGRTFEIQARLWIPPYTRHCALAGREENDMVIIDACSGTVNLITRFSSPPGQTPRVVVSGGSYQVFFVSGAYMRFDWGGWGANVYVTAPGQDWNRTAGICGNNNDRPGDDAPAYVVWRGADLFPSQRLSGRQDLWTWFPPASATVPNPPHSEECATRDTPVVPILTNPGGIDITNNIKNDQTNSTATTIAPFVINTAAPAPVRVNVTEAEAAVLCNSTILNSTLARSCAPLFAMANDNTWSTRYVKGCVEDIMLIGWDAAWIAAAMQGLQNECALLSAQFNMQLNSTFCPTTNTQPCSGRGTCNNNVCSCTGSFAGVDCSIDSARAPVVNTISASTCDVLGLQPCPTSTITVQGSGFLNTANLTCRFDNIIRTALFMGHGEVLCSFPTFALGSQQQVTLSLQVSNDRVTWSNPAPVTYYNSNCLLCTQANACAPNPNSCNIDGACHANGDVNFNNPCQVCDSTRNASSWSFSFTSHICWPKFDFPVYGFKVVGTINAGTELGTIRAINTYLVSDRSYTVNYSLTSTLPTVYFAVRPDPATRNNAIVYAAINIDVATLDTTRLPGTFTLTATDPRGNSDSASGIVNFIARDNGPVFNRTSYTATVPENTTVSTVLLTVAATASVNGGVTYDWVISDTTGNKFGLNPTTGAITLLAPLDFSDTSSYFLQVKAIDTSGQYQVVDVRFTITYVPKPATNILLSTTSFDEKSPVGTVIATLSAVDPGSSSWTYTLNTASVPFAVNGSSLVVTALVDFEVGPRSFSLSFTVRDETNLIFTKTIVLTVINVIEPPSNVKVCPPTGCGSAYAVPDDTRTGQVIGVINYTNPDGAAVTCRVFPNTSFGVVATNGVSQVILLQALDFVIAPEVFLFPSCSVVNQRGQVVTSTSTMTTITVINTPKPPKPPVLTVDPILTSNGGLTESSTGSGSSGTTVGTLTSSNPNPLATNMTFTILGGSTTFTLGSPVCSNATGTVTCTVPIVLTGPVTGVIYNDTGYGYVPVTIRSTDSGSGKAIDTVINVPVTFVNSEPNTPAWVGGFTVQEQSPVGTEVGVIELSNPYPFAPETARLIDNSQVSITELTLTRRSVAAKPRYSVRISNPNLTYMTAQTVSFTVNVSNAPSATLGAPLWALHTMSFSLAHKPMTPALLVGTARLATNATVDVNERTPGFSVVGNLVVDNMNRADLDVAYTLLNDGQGYFALSGSNLVTSTQFLEYSTVQFLTVAVLATFTAKPSATNVVPFNADALSYFRIAVQPVTAAPQLLFAGSSTVAAMDATVMVDTLPNVATVATFQVSGRRNSALRPTLSNDPLGLFNIVYNAAIDSFQVNLVVMPSTVTPNLGFYSLVGVTVPDNTATITGAINITLVPNNIILTGGGPTFEESKSAGGVGGTALAGVVVGAVVGVIVLVLLVALVVIRRRKRALDTKIANEPFYSQVHANTSLDNPTYLDQMGMGSSLGFAPGIQNPMYAWYRPDLGRQESEEYLADQVDGAFVIRDSAATPGWHMLAVKTHNAIVHEKIKMGEDGLYELLPGSSLHQPKFREMPLLVEHYAEQQAGIRYSLALDNPLYDNSHMAHKKHGHAVAGAWSYQADPNAPSVPLKERELAAVQQIAEAEGDEIYTNQEQAKNVISSA